MTRALEPMWDIVEEHLDEAEFLWGVWERSLVAPHYTLAEVAAGPEMRLLAHVDALVVNGTEVATRLLVPTLHDAKAAPDRVRAAALALLQTRGRAGVDAVLAALSTVPARHGELARALECCARPDVLARLRIVMAGTDAAARAVAARVLLAHGEPVAEPVAALVAGDLTADRRVALTYMAFETGGDVKSRARAVVRALAEPELVEAALAAGALLKLPQAWQRARALVEVGDPGCGPALVLLALRGDAEDRRRVIAAADQPALRGAALWALGFLGTAEAVETCVAWLDDEVHARVAGEAVAAITGLDLVREKLVVAAVEDEALERRAEDELPVPDAAGVRAWWAARGGFAGRRMGGRALDEAALLRGLRVGPMRRRGVYLLALRLLGVAVALRVDAPTRLQRAALG